MKEYTTQGLEIVSKKKPKKGRTVYTLKCGDCGSNFERDSRKASKVVSCGCRVFRRDIDVKTSLYRKAYSLLKYRHTQRFKTKIISIDYFIELSKQNCFYSGLEPSNILKSERKGQENEFILISGIDRIDSSKGYVKGNVVPCSKYVNIAKSDQSEEQFLDMVRSIYENLDLGNK